jgi:hypothetical protein
MLDPDPHKINADPKPWAKLETNDPPCLGDSEEEEVGVKRGAASAAHAPRGSGDAGEVGAVWSSGAVKGPLLLLPLPPSSVGRSFKKITFRDKKKSD